VANLSVPPLSFFHSGRLELLNELKVLSQIEVIDPTAWGCLWLSDLGNLQELIELAKSTLTSLRQVGPEWHGEQQIDRSMFVIF
jgi:hypothetical protein